MSIHFVSTNEKPAAGALVVCAGTVTCTSTEEMGSGFNLFKNLFNQDAHVDPKKKSWSGALQSILNNFHGKKERMPAYIRIAQQNGLIGGIATVPVAGHTGLTFELFSNSEEKKKAFINQYIEAVRLAVLDAIKLNRPLYIQPLGIGIYGWQPEEAAQLFVKAFNEVDPDQQVKIIIPMYQTDVASNDQRFKRELISLTKTSEAQKKATTTLASTPEQAKSNQKKLPEYVVAPLTAEPKGNNTVLKQKPIIPSVPQETNQTKLIGIINQLIQNIETKENNRLSSGKDSSKVNQLKYIKEQLSKELNNPDFDTHEKQAFIEQIRATCHIKRNFLHFWQTPHSVKEFEELLVKEQLNTSSTQVGLK